MTDRPTPPEPDRPDTEGPGADATAALPQSDPAATTPLPPQPPAAGQAAPGYGPPVQQGAGWPAGGVPAASAAGPGAPRPGGPRRWWDDATSTGAGRGALIAVAVLGSLLLVTGVGLAAALVAGNDRWDRDEMGWSSDDGPGNGNGYGRGNGNGRGNGMMGDRDGGPPGLQGRRADPANPNAPTNPNAPGNRNGNGNGNGLGRAAGALGAGVLHGEFTTAVTGTPTVMVVQTGEVTAYTAGKSLTVRSTDGFEATYTLDATVAASRGAAQLATGVQVRVVAAKEGMKVTALVVG